MSYIFNSKSMRDVLPPPRNKVVETRRFIFLCVFFFSLYLYTVTEQG